jgi:hypothetical protein
VYNLLDAILNVVAGREWKEQSSLPGWRGRPSRSRKSRIPFGSQKVRGKGIHNMETLAFTDKEQRNSKYQELRKEHAHVFRYSDHDGRRILWCVAYPRG